MMSFGKLQTWIVKGIMLLCCAITQPGYAAEELVFVTDEWPPYYSHTLPQGGLAFDIIMTAFKRAGIPVKIELMPWARCLAGVKSKEFAGLAGVWDKADRKEWMYLTDPFYTNELVLVKRKELAFDYNKIEGLQGKSIGVTRGYVYSKEFNDAINFVKREEGDNFKNIKLLYLNHLDFVVEDKLAALFLIKKNLPEAIDMLDFAKTPLVKNALLLAIRKSVPNSEEIIRKFNKSLQDMKADGSYDKIFEAHGFKNN